MSLIKKSEKDTTIVDDIVFVSGIYDASTISLLEQSLKKEKILTTLKINENVFYIADKSKIKKILKKKNEIKKIEFTQEGEIIFYYKKDIKVYKLTRIPYLKL